MTQEERKTQIAFTNVLNFYEDFYGVTYEVINVDTYVLYLDNEEEIGRIHSYNLCYMLSELVRILKEKVLTYD